LYKYVYDFMVLTIAIFYMRLGEEKNEANIQGMQVRWIPG